MTTRLKIWFDLYKYQYGMGHTSVYKTLLVSNKIN